MGIAANGGSMHSLLLLFNVAEGYFWSLTLLIATWLKSRQPAIRCCRESGWPRAD